LIRCAIAALLRVEIPMRNSRLFFGAAE